MPKILNIEDFISALDRPDALLIDARSPKEFIHAHVPNAINIPLLNDEHREKVGITYKRLGREAAVEKGFELVGPLFVDLIRRVKEVGLGKELFIYCWRGGMRSGILSWLLNQAGFKVNVLEGGYKSYRSLVLNTIASKRNVFVLGGKTGSGKTELLHHLADAGEQIIDLEKLAAHKGSAFGALGQPAQPSNEHFENLLFKEMMKLVPGRVLWLENESRSIGTVKIPDDLFLQMQNALVIAVDIPLNIRKQRILNEYGGFPVWKLKERTERLERRLGGLRLKLCLQALEENRKNDWLEYLLEYYDETYSYGMSLRDPKKSTELSLMNEESYSAFAERIIALKQDLLQITLNEQR